MATIEEARKDKANLESEISKLLAEYTDKHNLAIESVNITTTNNIFGAAPEAYFVDLKVKL